MGLLISRSQVRSPPRHSRGNAATIGLPSRDGAREWTAAGAVGQRTAIQTESYSRIGWTTLPVSDHGDRGRLIQHVRWDAPRAAGSRFDLVRRQGRGWHAQVDDEQRGRSLVRVGRHVGDPDPGESSWPPAPPWSASRSTKPLPRMAAAAAAVVRWYRRIRYRASPALGGIYRECT